MGIHKFKFLCSAYSICISYVVDLTEEARKKDLEKVFMKYGPLKEIWLASYAPIYAFVVFRNRLDAQVLGSSIRFFNSLMLRQNSPKYSLCRAFA